MWLCRTGCNLIHSHDQNVVLRLSGVCDRSVLDKHYHLRNDENGYLILNGFSGTIIQYDPVSRVWKLSVTHRPEVSGTSSAPFETLTLGNHEWEIINDMECKDGAEKKILTLSTCSEEQYTCNDGLCIDMESRCTMEGQTAGTKVMK